MLAGMTTSEKAAVAGLVATAGIHPAIIEAVRVCGFILTPDTWETFSETEVDLWESTIDAYMDAHPDAAPLD